MKKQLLIVLINFSIVSGIFAQADPNEYYFLDYSCNAGKIEEYDYSGENKILKKEKNAFTREIADGCYVLTTYSSTYSFPYANNPNDNFDIDISLYKGYTNSQTHGFYLSDGSSWSDERLIFSITGDKVNVVLYKDSKVAETIKSDALPSKALTSKYIKNFNEFKIRRYKQTIYLFLNGIPFYEIKNKDISSYGLSIEKLNYFGYQVDAGKTLKVGWYKYTPFEKKRDRYFNFCSNKNVISSSFQLTDNKEALPFYDEYLNALSFKDIVDENRVNILIFTKMAGMKEAKEYVKDNIFNWQMKFNASVKTILIDAQPQEYLHDLMITANDFLKDEGESQIDLSKVFYCPKGQFIGKPFNRSDDDEVIVAFVNEQSFLHYFNQSSKYDDDDLVENLGEIINNYKNNIFYFEEEDGCWYLTTEDNADYYRKIKKVNGIYNLTDYYEDGNIQMTGSYSSLYPSIRDGVFTWYHENGKKINSISYRNDKLDGPNNIYHDNGMLFTTRNYVDDKFMNVVTLKNSKGESLPVGTFSDGNGTLNVYSNNGLRLFSTQEYKEGILEGPVKFYFLNEKEFMRKFFEKGEYTGWSVENSLGDFGQNMVQAIKENNVYHIRDYIVLNDMEDSYGDADKMKKLLALNYIDYAKQDANIDSLTYWIKSYDPLKMTKENYVKYKNKTFNGDVDLASKIQALFSFMSEKYSGTITYTKIYASEYDDYWLTCSLGFNTSAGEKSIKLKFRNCQFGWLLYDIPDF